ncbi:MBL fold metallo-hydrolase [Patescibacteria group bacterium]|nr:MBL fold metallo-hydrolase [Patescibacteria group bacterium]
MKNTKLYILSFFFCVNVFIWYGVFVEERNFVTVAFLDVGQGDAIFIESLDGKQILIDGGANSQVLQQLAKVMPFYDRSIDMVILTHPDQDHIGGLPAVLESYTVDFVMESGVGSDNGTYEEFENIIQKKQIQKITAQQGQKIFLCNLREVRLPEEPHGCESYLEVLFPVGDLDISEFEPNTASVVLKLTHGENSFLFTGDSPRSIEKYLVESLGDYIDVDVLKLGHHGSKTSTSDLFLGFTSPEYTIASVGENNSYGHPHQEILDLLRQFEIPLLRTDKEGTIIFKSDGRSLLLE